MTRKRQVKAGIDDPLLRALKEHADEVLTEQIPERLLRILEAAKGRPTNDGLVASDGVEPEAPGRSPPAGRAESGKRRRR